MHIYLELYVLTNVDACAGSSAGLSFRAVVNSCSRFNFLLYEMEHLTNTRRIPNFCFHSWLNNMIEW